MPSAASNGSTSVDDSPSSRRGGLLLPLLPGVLAVLVALLIAPAVVEDPTDAKADESAVAEQVKKSTETVRRQLADRREQAKKKGLKDAERLLLKLEEGRQGAEEGADERKGPHKAQRSVAGAGRSPAAAWRCRGGQASSSTSCKTVDAVTGPTSAPRPSTAAI